MRRQKNDCIDNCERPQITILEFRNRRTNLLPRHQGGPEDRGHAARRLFLQLHGAEIAMDLLQRDRVRGYLGSGTGKGEGPGRIYVVEPTEPFTEIPM